MADPIPRMTAAIAPNANTITQDDFNEVVLGATSAR